MGNKARQNHCLLSLLSQAERLWLQGLHVLLCSNLRVVGALVETQQPSGFSPLLQRAHQPSPPVHCAVLHCHRFQLLVELFLHT